ncbi:MAG: (2Fe-2S)-binding protein [Bdellovibrionaceae bacterium]|nr:(2Fe-2S)-binding protein [Pseudobdellovibrionaceae bacterium]MDW8191114.1 2Fe-2S iron-sulfur cluster-binding protein [Pseudobdellovibrionaceae bacterium]
MKLQVEIENTNRFYELKVNPNLSLLENLLRHKIPIGHSCGGQGTCGTCQITVKTPELFQPITDWEISFFQERYTQLNPERRLSCQTFFQMFQNRLNHNNSVLAHIIIPPW